MRKAPTNVRTDKYLQAITTVRESQMSLEPKEKDIHEQLREAGIAPGMTQTEELLEKIARLYYEQWARSIIGDKKKRWEEFTKWEDMDEGWDEWKMQWFRNAKEALQACKEVLVFRDGEEIEVE